MPVADDVDMGNEDTNTPCPLSLQLMERVLQ